MGPITEAKPIAIPASTRQIPSSQIVVGRDEPIALTANKAAAMCITHSRPNRSASRPARAAPSAEPSSATATTVPVSDDETRKCTWMPVTAPFITALS